MQKKLLYAKASRDHPRIKPENSNTHYPFKPTLGCLHLSSAWILPSYTLGNMSLVAKSSL